MYLIDTDIISEVRKGQRCDPRVAAWYDLIDENELYLSVLVIGEIRQGAEKLRRRDPRQAKVLADWLGEVLKTFAERVLPVDTRVAQAWGRIAVRGNFPVVDALLAATAQVHGLILVTRNTADIEESGVKCLNPFDSQ